MSRMTMPDLMPVLIHPESLREQLAACRAAGGVPVHRPSRGPSAMGPWATPAKPEEPYARAGSAAVLTVDGPISYGDSFLAWLFGGTTNQRVVAAIEAARVDPGVETVCIDWHCPGGDVAGASDLVDAVVRCAAVKPVISLVHDLCASLAYWAACCGTKVLSTPTGLVGSIGAICVAYDTSKMAERGGVEAVVTTDAEQKGYGYYGAPITPEMRRREEAVIARMGEMFRGTVAERRGLDPEAIRAMQGAVYFGRDGVSAGLLDGIVTSESFYAAVVRGDTITEKARPSSAAAHAGTPAPPTAEPVAKEPKMSKVSDQFANLTEDEKKELKALLEEEDGESKKSESEEDDKEAEGGENDEQASAPVSPAQAIASAKAMVRDASPGLPDAEINRIAMESVEHGWSEARVYREIDKAEQAVAGLQSHAAASPGPVGGARPSASGAAFAGYDDAVRHYEGQGKPLAEAVAIVNREHPDLRAKKFASKAR